jgi:hypothetical protein
MCSDRGSGWGSWEKVISTPFFLLPIYGVSDIEYETKQEKTECPQNISASQYQLLRWHVASVGRVLEFLKNKEAFRSDLTLLSRILTFTCMNAGPPFLRRRKNRSVECKPRNSMIAQPKNTDHQTHYFGKWWSPLPWALMTWICQAGTSRCDPGCSSLQHCAQALKGNVILA